MSAISTPVSSLEAALSTYLARQDRREHPDGKFDKQGRWDPSEAEGQSCCRAVRSPSRAYPYSLMKHCRSVEHVAALYGVDASALRKAARKARPPAKREGGDGYFKAVAVVDGRYLSIYDGQTEYVIGQTMTEPARQGHKGGWYCYAGTQSAMQAEVPSNSVLENAPRAILQVRAEGNYCRYGKKLSFSRLTPIKVVVELEWARCVDCDTWFSREKGSEQKHCGC